MREAYEWLFMLGVIVVGVAIYGGIAFAGHVVLDEILVLAYIMWGLAAEGALVRHLPVCCCATSGIDHRLRAVYRCERGLMAFTTQVSSQGRGEAEGHAGQGRTEPPEAGSRSVSSAAPSMTTGRWWRTLPPSKNSGAPAVGIPERPFFRQSIAIMEDELPDFLAGIVDPKTMEVGQQEGDFVGDWARDIIQQRIKNLRTPPNSPITIHGGWIRRNGKSIYIKGWRTFLGSEEQPAD